MKEELVDYVSRLGLIQTQSLVYVALLELGNTNVGPIVSKTGLHRQQVYNSLADLGAMGLVSEVEKQGRKHFRTSPDALISMQSKKLDLARSILPELKKLTADRTAQVQTRVLEGRRGFYENLCTVADYAARGDKTIRFIDGSRPSLFYSALGDQASLYHSYVSKLDVKRWGIVPATYADDELQEILKLHKGNRIKRIPSGLSAPTLTRIVDGLLTIEVFEPELMVFQIRNPVVASAYREYFDLLWKIGSELKRRKIRKK